MRFFIVFLKTLREMRRDLLTLSLTIIFAPFFVFLYWLFTAGGSTTYTVLIVDLDRGALTANGTQILAGPEIADAVSRVAYPDGRPLLKVRSVPNLAEAERLLRERSAAAYILLPEDFSQSVAALRQDSNQPGIPFIFGGDLTNPYYLVSSILSSSAVEKQVQKLSGRQPLLVYKEHPIGDSGARTEFENYVPGILVFAVIMLIFLAAMTATREVENGTLQRLRLTPMSAWDFLVGTSAALILVGTVSLALALFAAWALGFHSQGPLWIALLVGAVTSLSVIGAGMLVAGFSSSVSQAFVIANFPLGLLMFFSGSIFPIPPLTLFTVGTRPVSLYDILPATHAVSALHKVLTLGAGIQEVTYELTALGFLSLAYFAVGVWLFQRRHLSAG